MEAAPKGNGSRGLWWQHGLQSLVSKCEENRPQLLLLVLGLTILSGFLVLRRKLSAREKNGWDSAKRALQKADIASVTGSFKDAGMSAQMGRRRRRRADHGGPDVEDSCVVQ